jgi:ABC-2 type transport system permease protein
VRPLADFWQLVRNENMKIYRRLATWIMLAITGLIAIGVELILYTTEVSGEISAWSAMLTASLSAIPIITIFTVVKAAEAVAGEFTWGTIKLLLIRPWKRSVILLSKYVSVLLFALLFMAACFLVSLLCGMLLFDISGTDEAFQGQAPLLYMLKYYSLRFISLIAIVSFGFMLSSAFRSSGLAIGLTMFLLMFGSVITAILAFAKRAWVKYVMLVHLDLTSYLDGDGPFQFQETTLGFSIAVLAAYVILFNFVSWYVFCKRDVSN